MIKYILLRLNLQTFFIIYIYYDNYLYISRVLRSLLAPRIFLGNLARSGT